MNNLLWNHTQKKICRWLLKRLCIHPTRRCVRLEKKPQRRFTGCTGTSGVRSTLSSGGYFEHFWPTVKVNWILDAKNNGKSYFDTVIQKKFENLTKSIKDKRKYVKYKNSQKPTKRQSDCHGCFINGYALW